MDAVTAPSTADPADLWEVVADVTSWPAELETFTSVTLSDDSPVPSGVGARYAVRQPGLAAAVYEVTEWDPGHSFTWVARAPGVVTTATHSVTPSSTGSTLTLGLGWTGLLAPMVRLLAGGRAERMVRYEADTLARLADHRE
ncbi:polyketide cyclase/dehydrase/lipid transport protein [Knoellia remsis]|uniref:Polyketide cyclase/dehydrase/lipid transport protein n=1 Tax=Knoellia remsis TaxID=407159 RepID=A0A2T0UJD0_9MICO|nr:SRPBCC family protein [Knoellia remsis]PRY58045.1 polyketide cyclase/dehydrase/lipid transport protein [Knoellia remsis]